MFAPWMADFHPFGLTGPARFRAPPPPELTSAEYTRDYNEVKAKGALTGSTRTPARRISLTSGPSNFLAQLNRALRAIVAKHVPRSVIARGCSRSRTCPWRTRSSGLGQQAVIQLLAADHGHP